MNMRAKVEALESVRAKHGELTPRYLRDEARNPKHPLHGDARWLWNDDRKAAERYRLDVAREIIGEVVITYVDKDELRQKVRAYHSLPVAKGRSDFQYLDGILSEAFSRKLLLTTMERDVNELVARYEHMQEFWQIWRRKRPKKAS